MSDPHPELFAMPPEPTIYLFRSDEKPGFLSAGSRLVRECDDGYSGDFLQTLSFSAAKMIAAELRQELKITILKCTEAGVEEMPA